MPKSQQAAAPPTAQLVATCVANSTRCNFMYMFAANNSYVALAVRGCDTAPATAANGGNWLSSTGGACSGVPSGGICRSNCTFSGTGGPYTATCIAGAWTVTGNCTRKALLRLLLVLLNKLHASSLLCSDYELLLAVSMRTNVECAFPHLICRAQISSQMHAMHRALCCCIAPHACCLCHLAVPTNTPAVKTCTNLPPAATNSVAWPSTTNSTAGITSCIGTSINSTCRTPCAVNAAGLGFTATCNDTNSWAVTGSCASEYWDAEDAHVKCFGLADTVL